MSIRSRSAFLSENLVRRGKTLKTMFVVSLHGLSRVDFDSLPGKVKEVREKSGSIYWVKHISPSIMVFTDEPAEVKS